MPLRFSRSRAKGDLPRPSLGQAGFLVWIIGVMSFLAALTLVAALMLNDLAIRWQSGLAGTITIEIPPSSAEAGQQADRVRGAVALLKDTPGISQVRLLSDAEIEELIKPWLGAGAAGAGLPLPAVVEAIVAPEAVTDLAALEQRLSAVAPGAVVNDHGLFLSRLLHLARLTRLVSFGLVGVIAVTSISAVAAVVRARFATLRGEVELLHTIGATDGYIARQFERQAFRVAGFGGIVGSAAAVATILVLADAAAQLASNTLLGDLKLSPQDWATVALVPALAIAIAVLAARWTVLRALRALP